ncbi:MAG: GntG family PLP-dependent aldolase [Candidatus Nanopelagicales bacterium]|nr:GntG family PLP-dependent aldolase [Candidatus Nanopelagicales bacterium]
MSSAQADPMPPIRVDLRSDTVTRPTPAMRAAMAAAVVGDDVYGEDPTVNALEARASALSGKEAALFVASGSMGNLVSVLAHVPRGGEVILPSETHILNDEAGSYSVVASAAVHPVVENARGEMPIEAVLDAIQDPYDSHSALTSLVVVENCHAHSMSRPITAEYLRALRAAVPSHLPIHVDGARLFNASVALGLPVAALLADADSAMFCLSKGLAAPVGSMVVGSAAFIDRARRARKLIGGGMRQAGVIAAAGLVALGDDEFGTVARLADDHRRARTLADGLAAQAGVVSPGGCAQPTGGLLDPARVMTNFVLYAIEGGDSRRAAYVQQMRAQGVAVMAYNHGQVRAVTHLGVDDADVDAVLAASERALAVTS